MLAGGVDVFVVLFVVVFWFQFSFYMGIELQEYVLQHIGKNFELSLVVHLDMFIKVV